MVKFKNGDSPVLSTLIPLVILGSILIMTYLKCSIE